MLFEKKKYLFSSRARPGFTKKFGLCASGTKPSEVRSGIQHEESLFVHFTVTVRQHTRRVRSSSSTTYRQRSTNNDYFVLPLCFFDTRNIFFLRQFCRSEECNDAMIRRDTVPASAPLRHSHRSKAYTPHTGTFLGSVDFPRFLISLTLDDKIWIDSSAPGKIGSSDHPNRWKIDRRRTEKIILSVRACMYCIRVVHPRVPMDVCGDRCVCVCICFCICCYSGCYSGRCACADGYGTRKGSSCMRAGVSCPRECTSFPFRL